MMFFKILESFVKTILIWVVTGLCFTGAFKILLKGNGLPWEPANNSTSSFMAMLSTYTKVSAMMMGELEVDDILKRNSWIANILLIIFEGTTVILLMNLMVSLAVGDVNDLRDSVVERVIEAKICYCIEVDSYYNTLCHFIPCLKKWNKKKFRNIVFIHKNGHYVFNLRKRFSTLVFPGNYSSCCENNSASNSFTQNSSNPNISFLSNESIKEDLSQRKDIENVIQKTKRWLFGINWSFAVKVKNPEFAFIH